MFSFVCFEVGLGVGLLGCSLLGSGLQSVSLFIYYDCLLVWLEVATGVGCVGVDFSAGSFVGYFVYLLVGFVVFQVSLLLD